MFCDSCGAPLQSGQAFCSKCGKQIVGNVAFAYTQQGRVQSHVRLAALLWLAFSAFNTIGAIILFIVATTFFPHMQDFGVPANVPVHFLVPLLTVIAILLFAKAAVGFLAGWGLLQHERWARILALVLGFIALFTNIPFGTALGVYTMWVLLPTESEREYEKLAEARAA